MNNVLTVHNLYKTYPGFKLDNVSFSVERGSIMGFIGRNGAGKTTTLKSLLNLIHPDSGEIRFFGMELREHEKEIKQRTGFASGGINYYQKKRMADIVSVLKDFYTDWDEEVYRRYLNMFSLDERKTPSELSEGMKVKFNLALALSHHAELFILDEPTSGLDPVSRDDLLEVFLALARDGASILFSTHITSDLEKCADSITYIQNGRILASCGIDDFTESYRLINISEELSPAQKGALLGESLSRTGTTALIKKEDTEKFTGYAFAVPALQTIMVHLEKGAEL